MRQVTGQVHNFSVTDCNIRFNAYYTVRETVAAGESIFMPIQMSYLVKAEMDSLNVEG